MAVTSWNICASIVQILSLYSRAKLENSCSLSRNFVQGLAGAPSIFQVAVLMAPNRQYAPN